MASCLWVFFAAASSQKPIEGRFEVNLPKDGRSWPARDEAEEKLRLQLRYDAAGRLRRWVNGREVHSDKELSAAIEANRSPDYVVPVGIDALRDMSWAEIVRTMGLCAKQGFEVTLVAPLEVHMR